MSKTRNIQVPQTAHDGADDISIRFYIADAFASPPNHPRVEINLGSALSPVMVDRPVSDFTNLTGPQKVALRNALTAIRDQALTLEGFS